MADKNIVKGKMAARRRKRVRGKVFGTPERPRLTVSKSLNNVFVQIIDDVNRLTLLGNSTNSKNMADKFKKDMSKTDKSFQVGLMIAEAAKAKGIESVVFDRNISKYHGRVKAVADGARKGGLKF